MARSLLQVFSGYRFGVRVKWEGETDWREVAVCGVESTSMGLMFSGATRPQGSLRDELVPPMGAGAHVQIWQCASGDPPIFRCDTWQFWNIQQYKVTPFHYQLNAMESRASVERVEIRPDFVSSEVVEWKDAPEAFHPMGTPSVWPRKPGLYEVHLQLDDEPGRHANGSWFRIALDRKEYAGHSEYILHLNLHTLGGSDEGEDNGLQPQSTGNTSLDHAQQKALREHPIWVLRSDNLDNLLNEFAKFVWLRIGRRMVGIYSVQEESVQEEPEAANPSESEKVQEPTAVPDDSDVPAVQEDQEEASDTSKEEEPIEEPIKTKRGTWTVRHRVIALLRQLESETDASQFPDLFRMGCTLLGESFPELAKRFDTSIPLIQRWYDGKVLPAAWKQILTMMHDALKE